MTADPKAVQIQKNGHFWPTGAFQHLVAPIARWILSDGAIEGEPVLKGALDRYWGGRLGAVPTTCLPVQAREGLAQMRSAIGPSQPIGGGFEMVEQAMSEPDALWFFELGSVSWMMRLRALRLSGGFPATAGVKVAERIEKLWATSTTAEVAERIDQATRGDSTADACLALYRVPIAIWNERDLKLAIRLVDHLAQRLDSKTVSSLGATWPLTIAMIHALKGDTATAADILDPEKSSSKPLGWSGMDGTEARYQRARYLWDKGPQFSGSSDNSDLALDILEGVITDNSSYLLRALTDKGWTATNAQGQIDLEGRIDRVLRENAEKWTRWQHAHSSDRLFKGVYDVVRYLGAQGYVAVAANRATQELEITRGTQRLDNSFMAAAERINSFMSALPAGLRLRMGTSNRDEIFSGENSVAAQFAQAVSSQDAGKARALAEALNEDLPDILRIGLAEYGMNISQSLSIAGRVVEAEAAKDAQARARLSSIVGLLNDCAEQADAVKSMSGSVGGELQRQVAPVWSAFSGILDRWGKLNARGFGRMRLIPPASNSGEDVALSAGGFTAVRVKVTDSTGEPISGVPVAWEVATGPAQERGDERHVVQRIAVTMNSGVAVLPVESGNGRIGESGTISVRILGQDGGATIPYNIGA